MDLASALIGSIEVSAGRVVIRFPEGRLLRLVARSVLLFAAVISFPWILAAVERNAFVLSDDLVDSLDGSAAGRLFSKEMTVDMRRYGLIKPGDRALLLGKFGWDMEFFDGECMELVKEGTKIKFPDQMVDFVFMAGEPGASYGFGFIEQVLKVGGIVAVCLGQELLHIPSNYRIVYVQKLGPTIVALKKIAGGNVGRRLLTVVEEDERKQQNSIVDLFRDQSVKQWNKMKHISNITAELFCLLFMNYNSLDDGNNSQGRTDQGEFVIKMLNAENASELVNEIAIRFR